MDVVVGCGTGDAPVSLTCYDRGQKKILGVLLGRRREDDPAILDIIRLRVHAKASFRLVTQRLLRRLQRRRTGGRMFSFMERKPPSLSRVWKLWCGSGTCTG
jgi:hypothetical protein